MALPATATNIALHTYDDLLAMPEDGNRYELIFGEIVTSPALKPKHQLVLLELASFIRQHVRANKIGEVLVAPLDVKFSAVSVVQPDIFVVRAGNFAIVGESYVAGTPDLVIEVQSPSNRAQDLVRKAALYLHHGVPEYWVVDPDLETVAVNTWQDGQYAPLVPAGEFINSSVLPNLRIKRQEIFAIPEWLVATKPDAE
jgi:Uma2 family endonuclease